MNLKFVGLDIETSGTELDKHQLIQIGVAVGCLKTFTMDVGYDMSDLVIDEQAMEVHKISLARTVGAKRPNEVDDLLCQWLTENDLKKLVAVGWNVAGFDMPFVRKYLPKASKFFSYRTVDLNAICFATGRFKHMKKMSKKFAMDVLGTEQWHDAGYDAIASLLAFKYLEQKIVSATGSQLDKEYTAEVIQ
jgi:DNA polymerase III epsilon subunit-like protein